MGDQHQRVGLSRGTWAKKHEANAAHSPAMLFSTIYTALIYGIYYSFFESFPLVFSASRPDGYGFDLGETGLAFIAVLIGMVTAVAIYCAYFYFIGDPKVARMEAELSGAVPPEVRLRPGLVATFLIPVGLFVFGKLFTAPQIGLPLRSLKLTAYH